MCRTLKLTIAYDGTAYVGWQRQASGESIQARLEQAIAQIEGRPVRVTGAGRTDAGVHAVGQVASVRLHHTIDPSTLVRAMNASLPPDVRVTHAEEAVSEFDARGSARAKTYRYRIVHGDVMSPFEHRYGWQLSQALDCPAMLEAGSILRGEHDFAAFQAMGSSVTTTIRTIFRFELEHTAGFDVPFDTNASLITIDVEGSGFLRHMVRTIVGTLVDVGSGRRTPDSVARALQSRDRGQAGPTAPARGLFLMRVDY